MRTHWIAFLLGAALLLASCPGDGTTDDDDGDGCLHGDEWDNDGDWYDECSGDCDDTDPTVYPGNGC